jgi:DNA-binding transcriptional LysR family regulator
MRIEQLHYLTAVEEHGTLRRAGEQLPLSQPALAEALTKLERELGTRLLDRDRTGTRISDEGRHLLPLVREVLDAIDRLRRSATEGVTGASSAGEPRY